LAIKAKAAGRSSGSTDEGLASPEIAGTAGLPDAPFAVVRAEPAAEDAADDVAEEERDAEGRFEDAARCVAEDESRGGVAEGDAAAAGRGSPDAALALLDFTAGGEATGLVRRTWVTPARWRLSNFCTTPLAK
jgi:hypothetical protein